MISLGEGWHNYHHAFPWDYKAAELTMHFNQSASIIRFFERIGLAYDLKTASPEVVSYRKRYVMFSWLCNSTWFFNDFCNTQVEGRIIRAGDGSHYRLGNQEARAAVTAWGPVHPLNPTYNTTLKAPDAVLKPEGLPLFHEKDLLNHAVSQRNSSAAWFVMHRTGLNFLMVELLYVLFVCYRHKLQYLLACSRFCVLNWLRMNVLAK